jgi:hypothetical protein
LRNHTGIIIFPPQFFLCGRLTEVVAGRIPIG